MTLEAAIGKAILTGAHQVYQLSSRWHQRGIRTTFTYDDRLATDWQVHYPEKFIGHSGVE